MTLALITALIIKHFICDFPLQRPYQYLHKGIYGHFGGILHAMIHAAGTMLVLAYFELPLWLSFVDMLIHYHVDWAKTVLNKRWKLTPAQPMFWHSLGADQLLHYLTYVLIVWIAL